VAENTNVPDDWEDAEDEGTGLGCIERWRNAGPEERKKMFALFEESGIFIASCRHRLVLLVCDMIKSGELYVIPH
jgi:Kyakuja-Dileera-Zisupton transposase